jgi:hypothetical protein
MGVSRQSGVVQPHDGRTLAMVTESVEQLRKVKLQSASLPLSTSPKLWVSKPSHLMQYSSGSVVKARPNEPKIIHIRLQFFHFLATDSISFASFLSKQRKDFTV